MEKSSPISNHENTDQNILLSPSLAEVALKYRTKVSLRTTCTAVTAPGKAEEILRRIWDPDTIQLREEFVVLLLNNAKK